MQISPQNSELPLVCRPDKSLWVLIVIFMALGLMWTFVPQPSAPPPTMSDLWAGVALVAFFTFPAIATAWYLMHYCIVADARGLTFRGFLASRFVAWNAIEDYELRVPSAQQSKSGTPRPYLKSGGKWRRLQPNLTGTLPEQTLLDCIVREAKWSRASSWQIADLRDDGEWPKHFEYRDTSGWKLVGIYLGCSGVLFGCIFLPTLSNGVASMLNNIAQTWSFLSFWDRVGFVAAPLLICGAYPLTILAQYPAIVARRRYAGQKIIATREEISLFRDGRRISLPWSEIESYHLETLPGHFQPSKCVIETRRERIEFLSGISGTKSLLSLVQNRAKNATTSKWLHPNGADEDALGGAKSLYRGGNIGVGPKIHHYRTRTARAMLPLGALMSVMLLLPLFTGNRNGAPTSTADVVMILFFLVCVAIPTLFGVLGVCFSHLQCEEDGLRQHSFLGELFVRWNEIEKFTTNGYNDTVRGSKSTLRYGVFIADASGLREEIERRSGIKCQVNSNAV